MLAQSLPGAAGIKGRRADRASWLVQGRAGVPEEQMRHWHVHLRLPSETQRHATGQVMSFLLTMQQDPVYKVHTGETQSG